VFRLYAHRYSNAYCRLFGCSKNFHLKILRTGDSFLILAPDTQIRQPLPIGREPEGISVLYKGNFAPPKRPDQLLSQSSRVVSRYREREFDHSDPPSVAVKNKWSYTTTCRSQRPRGLTRGSAAVRLLGSWVRIPPGAWISVSCELCVLSRTGLCVGPIPRLEESYRV
jgi:hypothetical protein